MHYLQKICAHAALLSISLLTAGASQAGESAQAVVPTDRALKLSDTLTQGSLKDRLQSCATHSFYPTDFSIAHRGAPLGTRNTAAKATLRQPSRVPVSSNAMSPLPRTWSWSVDTLSAISPLRRTFYRPHWHPNAQPPFVRPSESSPPARLAAPQIFRWRSSKPCAPARIAATAKLKTLKSI